MVLIIIGSLAFFIRRSFNTAKKRSRIEAMIIQKKLDDAQSKADQLEEKLSEEQRRLVIKESKCSFHIPTISSGHDTFGVRS